MDIKKFLTPKTCSQTGLFTNLFLTAFKIFFGITGRSYALFCDGLHSLSDILATGIVYIGVIIGEKPPDKEHPYGHGNAETISGLIVSLIILLTGLYALIASTLALMNNESTSPLNITLVIAISSILIKELLYRYTIYVAKKSNNPAVFSNAWHHRVDAYSSIAATLGIFGSKLGFTFLDPLAGLIVAFLILKIAVNLMISNIEILMDKSPDPDYIKKIRELILNTEGVRAIDNIKIHHRGSQDNIDLAISVDKNISVEKGHKIAHNVKNSIRSNIPHIQNVMVHVNPYKNIHKI